MTSKRKKKKKSKKEQAQGTVKKPVQEEPVVEPEPEHEPKPEKKKKKIMGTVSMKPTEGLVEEMKNKPEQEVPAIAPPEPKPQPEKKKKKKPPVRVAEITAPQKPQERKTAPARPAELDPLRKLIKADNQGKSMLKGKAIKLRVAPTNEPSPEIIMGKKKSVAYKLSPVALQQLNDRFKVPGDFVATLPPGLRADIYNWYFSALPKDQKWRIFTKGHFIRGLVFDNRRVAGNGETCKAIVTGALEENFILDTYCLHDHFMQFRVVLPDAPILFLDDKKEKGLFAGLQFTFSEIGLHTFKADFTIWREVSTVNIIPRVGGKRYFRLATAPGTPHNTAPSADDIKGVYGNLLNAIAETRERIEKARKVELTLSKFSNWIEKMRQKYRFASLITERATKRFESEEQNLWGAVCAFAYIAGKARDDIKRYELECMAGLFLENA